MPFDGIVSKCIVDELNDLLSEGRIEKAFQTERDEITLLVRSRGENHRLLFSASPNYARLHLTGQNKDNPAVPPVFCMLLRKHVVGGKIEGFRLYDYDRIIEMTVKTTNDFGEPTTRYMIIEVMGRHSNIMLLNENKIIIDSVKHVDYDISSVREVMPGRPYQLPPAQDKVSPADIFHSPSIIEEVLKKPENMELRVDKMILDNVRGFSPMLCREVCERADIPPLLKVKDLTGENRDRLISNLSDIIKDVIMKNYNPSVFFKDDKLKDPYDYHCMEMKQYAFKKDFSKISHALDFFYTSRDNIERLNQKKASIHKVIANNIDRCLKKIGILENSLREAAKMDTYKLYGELLTANIYKIQENMDSIVVFNYYSENMEEITIPLDPSLSGSRNAQSYFKKYAKARSTKENAQKQLDEARAELSYLEAVLQMLDMADNVSDINDIKNELADQGYIKISGGKRKKLEKSSKPRVYLSSDGFEILVGRNNRQNDELTLKIAGKQDIWFHTKDIPGSHVILKTSRKDIREIPEGTILEAANLAAFFSKASKSQNVPVDYTLVKNVRKPQGAKPGMVIYDSQHTLYITPKEEMIKN